MKKLFKRIAPLLLALVMVLGSCLTVSAATSLPSTDKEYEAIIEKYQQSGYPYAVIQSYSADPSACFLIFYYSIEPFVNNKGELVFSGNWSSYRVSYNSTEDYWSVGSSTTHSSTVSSSGFSISGAPILYSNFDIYRVGADKEKDEPFFRGPERPLVAAVRGAGPEEALKEVILLIPLSILFLAGCLGLRKGLRLLLTLLRRA